MDILKNTKLCHKACNSVHSGGTFLNREYMGKALPHMTYKHDHDHDELMMLLGAASGTIKLYMAICNNATFLVMADAIDSVKQHPAYKKKFSPVKGAFNAVLKAWKEYEHNLVYARKNRFFHLEDMTPSTRKKYGDITDSQYYEYWCGVGASAWEASKNELNSLRYKYQKSLEAHGVEHPKIIANLLLAAVCLELCVDTYKRQIELAAQDIDLPVFEIDRIFQGFSLKKVHGLWLKALVATENTNYITNPDEERNIELGIYQLTRKWLETDTLFDASRDATEAYEEVFRTKGEYKKAIRELADTKALLCSNV